MGSSGIVLSLFVIISTVCLCQGKPENIEGDVSTVCAGARKACTAKTMTRDICRSTWHALEIDMIRADTNNDCEVDEDDMRKNYRDNFVLKDDKICLHEFVQRTMSYFGLSEQFSTYLYIKMFESKTKCGDIDDIDSSDALKLRSTYLNSAVQNLISFCSSSNMRNTNIDCWNLPSICRDRMESLPACRKYNANAPKTLYMLLRNYRDQNSNSNFITYSQLQNDFNNNYDTNTDRCLTKQEFVRRLTTFFGFSSRFVEYYVGRFTIDSNGCINNVLSDIPRNGLKDSEYLDRFIRDLLNICKQRDNTYKTIRECAQIGETCATRFPNSQVCSSFRPCGLERYMSCINRLPKTACKSDADLYEIKYEKLKIQNQLNATCTADEMNGSPTMSTGLLVSALPALIMAALAWL